MDESYQLTRRELSDASLLLLNGFDLVQTCKLIRMKEDHLGKVLASELVIQNRLKFYQFLYKKGAFNEN